MTKRVLIVDDEPSIRKVLSAHLRRRGLITETAPDGADAIEMLESEVFHLVISDLKMPSVGGMELLRWTQTNQPGLPVVLITAHGTVDSAVEAIKEGAFDYVTKPFDQEELSVVVTKALATEQRNASSHLAGEYTGKYGIIGQSPEMKSIFALIEKVASSPTTVLITGESGTGKELIARALHNSSGRNKGPFIQINCGAIPENLFEAELFGYEKGAFTGATTSKPGRFEIADGGTIFLDEIGELPRDMQVKLLRALQEKTIDRIGGLRPIGVDVRLIAATNVDLERAVADGSFREDLYYRLNVIPLRIPPLRDRLEDIPLLVEHFLAQFNERLGQSVVRIAPDALAGLMAHGWPGNIRELENMMERLVLLCDAEEIRLEDLPGLAGTVSASLPDDDMDTMGLKEYVRVHTAKLERTRIKRVLEAEDGNVTRAAKRLGISRKSLQTKMKDYGLREPG